MRISDWSSDVCSSDLPLASPDRGSAVRWRADQAQFHLGTVAKEGEVRRRAVADAHLSGEGGVVVLACPKYRGPAVRCRRRRQLRSEEHTSELQSLIRIPYAVFCLHTKI